jgi:nucleotide-binding universal stress UspA family protein
VAANGDPRGFELGTDGPGVILVGLDGSPTSLRAAAYAAGLARRQQARLVVMYVATLPALAGLAPYAAGYLDESVDQRVAEVRAYVEAGAAHAGISVDFRSVRGDPYSELCRAATDLGADAVVVGASSHTGHRLVGSLAVRLVRAGRWPVTVVP